MATYQVFFMEKFGISIQNCNEREYCRRSRSRVDLPFNSHLTKESSELMIHSVQSIINQSSTRPLGTSIPDSRK